MTDLTHLSKNGSAIMVDITHKEDTIREAIAYSKVCLNQEIIKRILDKDIPKGDVLSAARLAGIMAAKKTHDLIPLCHPLLLTSVEISFNVNEAENSIEIISKVKTKGATGVEMEALTSASIAALTIYDMCKSMSKEITIKEIKLLQKTGGKSGIWYRKDDFCLNPDH